MLYDNKRWEVKAPVVRSEEPWRKLLLDAADVIEQRGWCQCRLGTQDGAVCAGGAVLSAGNCWEGHLSSNPIAAEAARRLRAHIGPGYTCGNIASWNDEPGRTKEEVLATLRAVANGE